MAKQKADKSALGGVADGEGHDANARALEPADNLEELADAIFKKHGELADRRVIPTPHGRKTGSCSFADTHTPKNPSPDDCQAGGNEAAGLVGYRREGARWSTRSGSVH